MPTLFTDPRSGGIKKSSGVNVLPIVRETWAEVRDDSTDIDWLICGYHGTSKTDITVLTKGHGGLTSCANVLPCAIPVFGGVRLSSGKFVTFFYADEESSVMSKGRASMHKNGVLNVLEGSVAEIDIKPGMTEDDNGNPSSFALSGRSSSFDAPIVSKTENVNKIPNNNNYGSNASKMKKNYYSQQSSTTTTSSSMKPVQFERKMKSLDINALDNQNPITNSNSSNSFDKVNKSSNTVKESSSESSLNNHQSSSDETTELAITTYVPYLELKGISEISMLPSCVDPLNREASLSDEEFYEVFGMEKESFYKLPTWKRVNQKKAKLLF